MVVTATAQELLDLVNSMRKAVKNTTMIQVIQQQVLFELGVLKAQLEARIAAGGG